MTDQDIRDKIAQYEQQRAEFIKQAELQLARFDGAIAALKELVGETITV